jgi:hypothetical protein
MLPDARLNLDVRLPDQKTNPTSSRGTRRPGECDLAIRFSYRGGTKRSEESTFLGTMRTTPPRSLENAVDTLESPLERASL